MTEPKHILEAALLASHEPLRLADLCRMFEGEAAPEQVQQWLVQLREEWQSRAVHLLEVEQGWRFQTVPVVTERLERLHPEKPPKYSRAVLETLAIIAYRQPVTRGDIEEIRGVTVATAIIKQLEDRQWIEAIGYREVPGRPTLFGTTAKFLNDLGLASLSDLPALDSDHPPGQVDWVEQLQQPGLPNLTQTSEPEPSTETPTAPTAPTAPAEPEATDSAKPSAMTANDNTESSESASVTSTSPLILPTALATFSSDPNAADLAEGHVLDQGLKHETHTPAEAPFISSPSEVKPASDQETTHS